jgi:hypothetical protein
MQNLMQPHCPILPFIADKTKQIKKRHSCENSVCSQHGIMWQSDGIGFWKCDLGLPSPFTKAVTTIIVWELSNLALLVLPFEKWIPLPWNCLCYHLNIVTCYLFPITSHEPATSSGSSSVPSWRKPLLRIFRDELLVMNSYSRLLQ